MAISDTVLYLIAMITVLVAVGVILYSLIYTNQINKKIQSGKITGKKLVDIPKAIMAAVIIVLLFYCILFALSIHEMRNSTVSRNDLAVIDVSNPDDYQYEQFIGNGLKDASYAAMYSKEENPGYSKEILKDGDFVFTVFKRTSVADNFHPDFLCYVDYQGKLEKNQVVYNDNSIVSSTDGTDQDGFGSGGYNDIHSVLYVGNLDVDSDLVIQYHILDEASEQAYKKAEEEQQAALDAGKYAQSTASARISFR